MNVGKILSRLALIGYFSGLLLAIVALAGFWHRSERDLDQPIEFPHYIHAGRLGLACTYCHQFPERSPHAGAPPLELCMNCHQTVAVDRPEVKKVREHYREKRPVVWNRVHALPGFVRFSHQSHLRVEIPCFACHGAMQTVTVARQVRPLKMGWCVSCHRWRGGPTDCGACHH